MKKCLLICIALWWSVPSFSQCTPSGSTVPGVTPDIYDNLPAAYAGNAYNTVIQVRTPLDTTLNGTYVKLTSVEIVGISNLPAGFSTSCNPSNCTLGPLSNGCMLLTGNPTLSQAGTYILDIDIIVRGKLYGIIPVTQQTKLSDYKIKIYGPPVANFNLSKYNVCPGEAVTFIDKSLNEPTSFSWTFTGGNPSASTQQNPVVTYSVPGDYNVKLKATSPAGNNSITKTAIIHVKNAPVASLLSYKTDTICKYDSLRIQTVQNNNLSYQWKRNGLVIPGATDFYYYARHTGDHSLVATNNNTGCSGESPTKRLHTIILNATVTSPTGTSVCYANDVILNAKQNPNFSYQWFRKKVPLPGETNSTFVAGTSGKYKVMVTNHRGCTNYSTPVQVEIKSRPSNPDIVPTGPTTFCAGGQVKLKCITAVPNITYKWYRNSSILSGETGSSYIATAQGYYSVKITKLNGCSSVSKKERVIVNCREGEGFVAGEILAASISPNPSNHEAVLSIALMADEYITVDIYDALGRKTKSLLNEYYKAGEHEFQLDATSLSKGLYLLHITTGKEHKTIRFVKSN